MTPFDVIEIAAPTLREVLFAGIGDRVGTVGGTTKADAELAIPGLLVPKAAVEALAPAS